MINIQEFIISLPDLTERIFSMEIGQQRMFAKKGKQKFLNTDFISLETEHPTEYVEKFWYYTSLYCLFPDNEIEKKFREIGLSDNELKWFVNAKKIEDELDKILKTKKAYFVKSEVLPSIRQYFLLNILQNILKTEQIDHEYFKAINRLVDRRETGSKKPKKARTVIDEHLDLTARIYDQTGDGQFVNRKLKTLFSGSASRRFLARCLIKQIQKEPKILLVDFYEAFFELLKLIILDVTFYETQKELENTHHYSYEKIKEHRARRVKDHLFAGQRPISLKRDRHSVLTRK